MLLTRHLLPRGLLVSACGVGLAAATAACGLAVPSAPSAPASGAGPAVSLAPAMPAALTCTFSAATANVVVQFSGPQPSCNPWLASLSSTGLSFLTVTGASGPASPAGARICQLQANGLTMTVTAGGHAARYGDQICAAARRADWAAGS